MVKQVSAQPRATALHTHHTHTHHRSTLRTLDSHAAGAEGNGGAFGAVGAVSGVKNPIQLAKALLVHERLGRLPLGRIRPL